MGTNVSWAKTDVTSTYLTNAGLVSLDGWTILDGTMKYGGYEDWQNGGDVPVIEFYHTWSSNPNQGAIGTTKTFNFSQKANLPAGYYRLAVNAFYREGGNGNGTNTKAYIYAGEKQQFVVGLNVGGLNGYTGSNDLFKAANAFSQGAYSNEFDFHVSEAGEVEIGFHGYIDTYCSWCILGPVTLYEYTAADYIDDYRAKVTEAEALYETPMYGDDLVALKAAIVEEETLTTVDDVTSAINTLSTAINDALNSISKYAVDKADFDAIKGAADAIIAVDYTETSSGSHSTFESAIATQNNAANGAANADAMAIAISNLKEAIKAYIAGAEPKNDGEFFDVTCLMVNPNFEDSHNGWTYLSAPNVNWSNCEYYKSEFDINQTVTGLPIGSYSLSVQAFQRPGWAPDVYNDYTNGIDNASSVLYINNITSNVKNIAADAQSTGKLGDDTNWNSHPNDSRVGSEGNYKYVPNSQQGANLYFGAGLYDATCAAVVTDEDGGSLKLGFKSTKNHVDGDWTIFDNFRLYYFGSSLLVYYKQYLPQLKSEASADLENALYVNVTGEEKTDFQTALAATPASETEAAYKAVIEDIAAKQSAFREAKVSYDAWEAVKDVDYANDKPYASAEKYAAIATAQAAATPTTAATAATAANAVISAYRLYVESNAMAEGVDGAEDKTSLIADPNFVEVTIDEENQTAGGWKYDQIGENVNISNYQPLTDGSGNTYSYFDYYDGSNNNQNIYQVIEDLEPGRYLLTTAGRGAANFNDNLQLYVEGKGSVMIPAIGGDNGTFGNGWNDVSLEFNVLETSDITIGVKTDKDEEGWWSATRFRLVKLGNAQVTIDENIDYVVEATTCADVTLNRTIKANTWNTFVVPFDIDNTMLKEQFGGDVEVAICVEEANMVVDNSAIYFYILPENETGITANVPVLLKTSTAGSSYTFNGVTVKAVEGELIDREGTNYDFVGTYAASITLNKGDYFIGDNKLWEADPDNTIVRGTRAYFRAKNAEARIIDFRIGEKETTGIVSINNGVKSIDNATFDLQGRKVTNVKKGLYIKNSKKVVVK